MEFAIMPLKSEETEIAERSGFEGIELRSDTLFASREEAEGIIEAACAAGNPCAVRIKHVDIDALAPTVTMEQIADRVRRMGEQRDKFEAEHSIHTLAAKLITCTKCDSRIAKDWVEGEHCPVCGNDLRSPYIPEQIATYEAKMAELREEYAQARDRQVKRALAKGELNARVTWLVPISEQ